MERLITEKEALEKGYVIIPYHGGFIMNKQVNGINYFSGKSFGWRAGETHKGTVAQPDVCPTKEFTLMLIMNDMRGRH